MKIIEFYQLMLWPSIHQSLKDYSLVENNFMKMKTSHLSGRPFCFISGQSYDLIMGSRPSTLLQIYYSFFNPYRQFTTS
jgi:hypothetical protein